MQPEQIQSFHQRLNQWVASQGFWFQIRYAMIGENLGGKILYHALKITTRLAVFAGILLIAGWIYLLKRSESGQFANFLREGLRSSLNASQLEVRHQREQGYLEINRLGAEGGPESFFSSLEARNVRCKMGLADGLLGIWEPGVISIHDLDLDLRAGADDAESARRMAEIVFTRPKRVSVHTIVISNADLRWGFSTHNQGLIRSCHMTLQRTTVGWRISIKGGTFTQNWLRRLTIEEMVVLVEPGRVQFEKALLSQGEQGQVNFSGLQIQTGAQPDITGRMTIRNLDFQNTIPEGAQSMVTGSFSAELDVSGSTNLSEGIVFQGQARLDPPDTLTFRDKIPVLEALSVVDYARNYRRIDFQEGSFRMKTKAGSMEATDIDLRSVEGLALRGSLTARPPNNEEIKNAFSSGRFGMAALMDLAEQSTFSNDQHAEFTLLNAAKIASRESTGYTLDHSNLFERLRLREETHKLEAESAARLSKMMRYEGKLFLSLPADAFDESPNLLKHYPVNQATNSIEVPIPVEGHAEQITRAQADMLYQEGKR